MMEETENMDQLEFLKSTELLADVSDTAVRQIRACLEKVRLKADTPLFHQGDEGDALYLLVSGELRLEHNGVPMLICRRGEWVGELALVDNEPRSASAIVQTDSVLLKWERERFLGVITQRAEVAFGIFKTLSTKLRRDTENFFYLEIEQELQRREQRHAAELISSLLPDDYLRTPMIEAAGHRGSAIETGGSFYDYAALESDQLVVTVANSEFRDMEASVFFAMTRGCVRTQIAMDARPMCVLEAMERNVTARSNTCAAIPCATVLIDPKAGSLRFANAGYTGAWRYCVGDDQVAPLPVLDTPLNVARPGHRIQQNELGWTAGDVLVFCSGNIVEGETFEWQGLEQTLHRARKGSAVSIRDALTTALEDQGGGAIPAHDVTIVVVT